MVVRTWSYAGGVNSAGTSISPGGFDPTVSVYDSQGNFIVGNRDGECGLVAADPVTSFCWDSYLALTLPAGSYAVVLTQSENLPNGPTLADSFVYHGQTAFTTPAGANSQGFWDQFPSKRTNAYALDILGVASHVTSITSVPQLPLGIVGQFYGPFTFQADAGSNTTLSWSIVAGSLPPGLTLDPLTGVLSGAAQSPGSFQFTVQVSDGLELTTQNVSLKIYTPVSITTGSLPAGVAGKTYGPLTLGAMGGSGSYSWTAVGLPGNLDITTYGVITGTPTQSGSTSVQVSVVDVTTQLSASASLTLTISAAPLAPLVFSGSGNLGGFVPGAKISGAFTASGGLAPYKWSAAALPAGLSLNSATGGFSGTVGTPGYYSFAIQVADSQSPPFTATLNASYSVLGITTVTLPGATTTAPYSGSFNATGGTPPYAFSATGMPQGLALSSAGFFSGTPTAAGSFTISVQLTDSTGLSTSSAFVLAVTGPSSGPPSPLTVPDGALTAATVSVPYSSAVPTSGGTPPYTWSIFMGTLPAGLSLTASGTVQGMPTAAGNYSFAVQVSDAAGARATGTITLVVNPSALSFSAGTFPVGIAGSDYPVQILAATGGVAPYTFALSSGSLPDGLILSGGQISGLPAAAGAFSFTLSVTDSAGKSASSNRSITISAAHADLILSQRDVSFSLTTGASGVPTPANVTVRSSVVQQLLNYSVVVSPAASWLAISGGGTTPGAVGVALNASAPSLPASTTAYATVIEVTCIAPSPCAGNVQSINVSLLVSAPPPQLSLSNATLSFTAAGSNPMPSSQSLGLQNAGGGTITIYSITGADSWLSISGAPSTLTAGPAVPVKVTADPTALSSGYFSSRIIVDSSVGVVTLPVTLLVTRSLTMTLGPSGAQFSAPAGSFPGHASGSFSVSVEGGGVANWSASIPQALPWLSLNSSSGSSSAGSAAEVDYILNATAVAALAPGSYYATIQVASPNVVDSPVNFEVVLNITPAATQVEPVPSSSGTIFVSSAGGSTSPQTIAVYSSSTQPVNYQTSAVTTDGAAWLAVSPPTGSASSTKPGSSSISVNVTGLSPGVYTGDVSYAFSSEAVRTVNITLLVLKAGTVVPPSAATSGSNTAATTCTPTRLIATQTGLFDNFAQLAGWPTPLAITLINDCGSAVTDGQLITAFSNGDPPLRLALVDSSSGLYLGTWTPQAVSAQVTVTAAATDLAFPAATALVTGEVRSNSVPILEANGIVHAFNPLLGAALAPGEIVSIYGTNLAGQVAPATAVPLTTNLAGTSVLIGGITAPLYYVSPSQINAQVPFELAPGNEYQIQVNANGALTASSTISIVATAPGIAAATSGLVLAQHAADYTPVSETSPARPGEYIVLYLAGLGATDNFVPTGAAAPSSPLSHPLVAPTVTLNGSSVPVAFAGLAPGFVGLYQINLQIPANAANGDVLLSVGQGTSISNVTILPVRQ